MEPWPTVGERRQAADRAQELVDRDVDVLAVSRVEDDLLRVALDVANAEVVAERFHFSPQGPTRVSTLTSRGSPSLRVPSTRDRPWTPNASRRDGIPFRPPR